MIPKTIVFDLDDTIIKEIDYLKSAFQEIAHDLDSNNKTLFDNMMQWYYSKENVFLNLQKLYKNCSILDLKNKYRNHFPNFDSNSQNRELLLELKKEGHFLGVITDGYSITQRNKLKALNIENIFDLIIISEEFGSEKPTEANYVVFDQFNTKEKIYIGDNTVKDFITPNRLGWTTICLLDNGENIHTQDFNKDSIYLPKYKLIKLSELKNII